MQNLALILAIATLQDATELDPRNIDSWNQLGLALMKRGEAEEAEESFQRGLRLDDENASINLNYAFLLLKQDRASEAIERLEIALHDFTYRQPALVLNSLGYAYYTQSRYGQAVARLREAVLRAPHYCQAWYNLGLAYEGQESPAEAIEAYDRVVMICSEEAAGSYFRAALLLLATGREREGAQYLHRVCVHTRGGPIHSPEVVRCACRPKCACRVRIGEELGMVGGVRQGVLGLVRVDGRQQVGRSHRRVIFVSVVRLGCWGSVPLRWWPSTA